MRISLHSVHVEQRHLFRRRRVHGCAVDVDAERFARIERRHLALSRWPCRRAHCNGQQLVHGGLEDDVADNRLVSIERRGGRIRSKPQRPGDNEVLAARNFREPKPAQ